MFLFLLIIQDLLLLINNQLIITENKFPWNYEGLWIDCNTKMNVEALNCQDELEWKECYIIPANGICNSKAFTLAQPLQGQELIFQIEIFVEVQQNIQINIADQSINLVATNDIKNPQSVYQSKIMINSAEFNIQINGQNIQSVFIGRFKFFSNSIDYCSDYHDFNNPRFECISCLDNYFLFNYLCVNQNILGQQSQIGLNFATIQTELGSDSIIVTYQIERIQQFDETMKPMIYLQKDVIDDTVLHYMRNNELKIQGNTIQTSIPFKIIDWSKFIETKDTYYYIYNINLAITTLGITQYMKMARVQLSINKIVQADYKIDSINFTIPSTCCSSQEIQIIGNTEIMNKYFQHGLLMLKVNQSIADPTYKIFNIQFESATLSWSDEQKVIHYSELILSDIEQQGDSFKIMILIEKNPSGVSITDELEVEIKSSLIKNQRLLQTHKSNLKNIDFKFVIISRDKIIQKPEINQTDEKMNAGEIAGIVIGSFFGLLFLCFLIHRIFFKNKKVHIIDQQEQNNKQNKENQSIAKIQPECRENIENNQDIQEINSKENQVIFNQKLEISQINSNKKQDLVQIQEYLYEQVQVQNEDLNQHQHQNQDQDQYQIIKSEERIQSVKDEKKQENSEIPFNIQTVIIQDETK